MATPPRAIEYAFPGLVGSPWLITSQFDVVYNCIAWAVEDTENWWWPSGSPGEYWPPGVPLSVEDDPDVFFQAFRTCGYVPCGLNAAPKMGVEKIALFTQYKRRRLRATHAARLLQNGCWTSKLGKHEDIVHHLLQDIEGSEYGEVHCIFGRYAAP